MYCSDFWLSDVSKVVPLKCWVWGGSGVVCVWWGVSPYCEAKETKKKANPKAEPADDLCQKVQMDEMCEVRASAASSSATMRK